MDWQAARDVQCRAPSVSWDWLQHTQELFTGRGGGGRRTKLIPDLLRILLYHSKLFLWTEIPATH